MPDMCIEYLYSYDFYESHQILIMYPYKLHGEKILRDNIVNMKNVVKEYINELEQYRRCMDIIPYLIWDSQKISMRNEADKHQRKADKIAEQMNNSISPYAWFVKKNFDECVYGIHYKADYLVYLEKI